VKTLQQIEIKQENRSLNCFQ